MNAITPNLEHIKAACCKIKILARSISAVFDFALGYNGLNIVAPIDLRA